MLLNLDEHPHRRFNPLTREWVLVSPHRAKRPWQGQVDQPASDAKPSYDPACYLCPGNIRVNGERNPAYTSTFVFENDFPALLMDTPGGEYSPHPLIRVQGERGLARVVCFSPRHDLTLAEMTPAEIRPVIDTWVEQYIDLASKPLISYVQVFENRGTMMGASNPHPHGQIWASERLPQEVATEDAAQRDYWAEHKRSLLADYLSWELKEGERIIAQNDGFAVLVPFWAVWPFETMIISKRHVTQLRDFTSAESDQLAEILHQITVRYDNLFRTSFPYSMGLHQRPVRPEANGGEYDHWHWHAHFYPPLLRSASVRKFLVGYEMLGTAQRDITPEQAAQRVRGLPATHYKHQP